MRQFFPRDATARIEYEHHAEWNGLQTHALDLLRDPIIRELEILRSQSLNRRPSVGHGHVDADDIHAAPKGRVLLDQQRDRDRQRQHETPAHWRTAVRSHCKSSPGTRVVWN